MTDHLFANVSAEQSHQQATLGTSHPYVPVCTLVYRYNFYNCAILSTCPFYRYCGPGTRLTERLAHNIQPKNKLDELCRTHDIAYSETDDLQERHKSDKILSDKAWDRVRSSDAKIGEKIAALGVTGIMKLKRKLGMGIKKKGFPEKFEKNHIRWHGEEG